MQERLERTDAFDMRLDALRHELGELTDVLLATEADPATIASAAIGGILSAATGSESEKNEAFHGRT